MAKKKIQGYLKLQVPAQAANPSPPLGPALGQAGLNIMEFCKAFNAKTDKYDKNTPLPTIITVYADKSFSFVVKTPPASYLLLKAANLKKGASAIGTEIVGSVSRAQVKEIAEMKLVDLSANDVDAAMKIIEGSARSMGIEVKG